MKTEKMKTLEREDPENEDLERENLENAKEAAGAQCQHVVFWPAPQSNTKLSRNFYYLNFRN